MGPISDDPTGNDDLLPSPAESVHACAHMRVCIDGSGGAGCRTGRKRWGGEMVDNQERGQERGRIVGNHSKGSIFLLLVPSILLYDLTPCCFAFFETFVDSLGHSFLLLFHTTFYCNIFQTYR